ncbi:MAG: hypothetical protein Q8J66_04275 [Methylotenera sp.]|nr:hypothetical protein [Methylotenera sp.]
MSWIPHNGKPSHCTLSNSGASPRDFRFAVKVKDGTHRIELKFTAKNALGGRVRSEAICGFKTEKDVVLNPNDIFNQDRELARSLRDAGINLH